MATTINIVPRHFPTGDWSIQIISNTSTTGTFNDCVLTKIGDFTIGSDSDLDESFSMPPNVDMEFQIRPMTENNLNLMFNIFTTYTTEVIITKDSVTFFRGYIDPVQTEIDPYNYTISVNITFATYVTKSVKAKDNPLDFNIGASAPQTDNYFMWYYFDAFFDYLNLAPNYTNLEIDQNIIGRYFNGEDYSWATVSGHDNGGTVDYISVFNPFWMSTGYGDESPTQLGDTMKNMAKYLGLIFTIGLGDTYYLQSRWKVAGKTPVIINREKTIEHFTRTILAKDGMIISRLYWDGSAWGATNTYTLGNVVYDSSGNIENSNFVEKLDIYCTMGGAHYHPSYPDDVRYNVNTYIADFSVDGGSTWGNIADVLEEIIWDNIGRNRRNTVVTVDGIDWDYLSYYTLEREINTYTYRVRQMKINVEKNQTELDLIQIF